ncbi:hypothetical protein GGR51DRAFT_354157 [Nemania sp. FL0031]|nr:hypothetical protein GGR51DRAFT_354157 [Nemania sp. FL0031]
MGGGRSRNKYAYQPSDDDNDLTESDSQATTDNETEDDARAEMENALVQSALARIRKARARGKQDVKLNKGEVAALERRRKRLEAEDAARRRDTDRKRRKEKEQRIAVPLSHFDSHVSSRGGPSTTDDALQRHPLSSTIGHGQGQSGPPVGYFSPPNASQARPRSSTPSSHHSSSQHTPKQSSSLKNLAHEEDQHSHSPPSPPMLDPFQYQTGGPYAPYSADATTYGNVPPLGASTVVGSGSGEITPEGDNIGSFDYGDTAQIGRSQEEVIVIESSPEQELGRSRGKKAASRNSSLGKRSSGSSRRRRDR